jgi:hypothetical protein
MVNVASTSGLSLYPNRQARTFSVAVLSSVIGPVYSSQRAFLPASVV